MLLLIVAASLATARTGSTPDPCDGSTTIAMNACLAGKLERAEAELARYDAAALARLREAAQEAENGSSEAALPTMFEKAARAWAAYRDTECDALYAKWSGGTIRTAMGLSCRLSMTRQRTRTIWRNWLTYADSTPPVLPEPKVPTDE